MNRVAEFVEYIRDWDTWRWKYLYMGYKSRELNDLLRMLDKKKFYEFCCKWLQSDRFPWYDESIQLLINTENSRRKRYINQKDSEMITYDVGDEVWGVVFAEEFISDLGNELCTRHPEISLVAIIQPSYSTVSLRTVRDDINVSDIAKKYGGGRSCKISWIQYI